MSLWWSGGRGRGRCLWGSGRAWAARSGDNCIPRSLSVIDSRVTNMRRALMMFTKPGRNNNFFSLWLKTLTRWPLPSEEKPLLVLSVTKYLLWLTRPATHTSPDTRERCNRLLVRAGAGIQKRRKKLPTFRFYSNAFVFIPDQLVGAPVYRKFLELFFTSLTSRKSHPGMDYIVFMNYWAFPKYNTWIFS